MIDEGLIKDS
ncbi:c19d4608-c23e-42bd-a1b5-fed1e2810f64 [Thermothielavioides terrestris]|uniref:C19d4608-c23e-42bd-a1b5-fed1e2810f64 n=1 Tax=Thermothielavioides terrestris TaxID=2587410 RepID=A0A446BTF2_9PEZI|nr:c19d4608-c23e-42bd-a1b5-fed1e2810f64 [Thermothielavioides terrestris]